MKIGLLLFESFIFASSSHLYVNKFTNDRLFTQGKLGSHMVDQASYMKQLRAHEAEVARTIQKKSRNDLRRKIKKNAFQRFKKYHKSN